MRIAMFSWETLHSIAVGGIAQHVTELAAALERKGHEVHVFTRMAPGQLHHERVDGVYYHRCATPNNPNFVDGVNEMCSRMVDQLFWVADFVGDFDVIHAHDWLTANAMIWVKQGRNPFCILTIHSTEYGRAGNEFHDDEQSMRIRHQERAGTYWADRVIAVSETTKDEVAWMYECPPEKIHAVYNGVTPSRFEVVANQGQLKQRYGIGPTEPVVMFVGRLAHQKGPDLMLESLPDVLSKNPSLRYVYVGDGHLRQHLEHRAKELGVAHAVRFTGWVDSSMAPEMFAMADAVCVPSRNEPFGIIVLEAWSAGKPVVATNSGGPNEFVWHGTNGLKVTPDPWSIAQGINDMFSDYERAKKMGEHGKYIVSVAYTWDAIAEKTLGVYGIDTGPTPLSRKRSRSRTRVKPQPLPIAAVEATAQAMVSRPA